jgi:K+-transporting ATPase ATPase C chain
MMTNLITALKMCVITLLLTGVLYPLLITGVSYTFFPKRAGGSLVRDAQGKVIGSSLIGQQFQNPAYFFARPTDAEKGYANTISGASNFAPTSKQWIEKIHQRVEAIRSMNDDPIPVDLIMSSGSGLDPHISAEAAYWQAPRIALKRDVSLQRVMAVIDQQSQHPLFFIFGNPPLNVLALNLALDQFFGPPTEAE